MNIPDFVQIDCSLIPAAVAASFVPLGEASSPAGLGTPADNTLAIHGTTHSVSGYVTNIVFGNGTPDTLTPGSLSRGTRLFLIVDSRLGPIPGIFSADTWLVPAFGDTFSLRLADINTSAEVFHGQLSSNGFGSTSLIAGSLCPEPGSALLAIFTATILTHPRHRPSRTAERFSHE